MAKIDLDAIRRAVPIVTKAVEAAGRLARQGDPAQGGYWARQRGIVDEMTRQLAAEVGARISDSCNNARVTIAGLTATSTTGVTGALHNWLTAAMRRLEAE